MNTDIAWSMARDLVREHLPDFDVSYDDRLNMVLGGCYRKKKLIVLNPRYVEAEDWIDIKETVLHEIAHGLSSGHHDQLWKSTARRLGCEPKAFKRTVSFKPKTRYTLRCQKCGRTWGRVKMTWWMKAGTGKCPYDRTIVVLS